MEPRIAAGAGAKVVTAAEMRRLEAEANAAGLPFDAMMERAGRAVADEVLRHVSPASLRVLVLAGPGNNGGDGLVAARCLHDAGALVNVALSRPRGDGDPHVAALRQRGVPCLAAGEPPADSGLAAVILQSRVVIDAVLGTGAELPVRGSARTLLAALLAARAQLAGRPQLLVAVDLPSGVDADTGAADAVSPRADLTVTFACPKRGHFLFPGADRTGRLVVADIGLPPHLADGLPVTHSSAEDVSRLLPARPRHANKGTFGKALLVAGSINYIGAAALAARSAARVGAGLVTLAAPASLIPVLAAHILECTFLPLPECSPGTVGAAAAEVLKEAAPRYSAVLIGPGLGAHEATRRFVLESLGCLAGPFVLDADALNAVAGSREWWRSLPPVGVLTPHPGEMGRLTGLGTEPVQNDRFGVALRAAAEWGQVVVLKGACTLIAAPDGRLAVTPWATPALATAGSGDVLAGAMVGLLAQGSSPYDAARAAAFLHGACGDLAEREIGAAGVLAGDLPDLFPRVLRRLGDALAAESA